MLCFGTKVFFFDSSSLPHGNYPLSHVQIFSQNSDTLNLITLRKAKTVCIFGLSECNRIKGENLPCFGTKGVFFFL